MDKLLNKIGDTLHIGGGNKDEENKASEVKAQEEVSLGNGAPVADKVDVNR